ncbi:MAG: hypothetical protein ACOX68_02155 [Candidatus Limivicinus sp.]|jgi:hypothetical protein
MKIKKQGKLNISREDAEWLVLFIAVLILMLWKCPFGFGGDDEGFYPTVACRLCNGEKLFRDEWHLSQLYSFLSYPFVSTYRALKGSNEGLLLASRYLYIAIHSAVAAVIYLRLKKYGQLSIASSILFMLFTPFDMMTCSYNTMALDMLALTGVMLSESSAGKRADKIVGGVSFALAVVCCPYMALFYFAYFLAVVILSIKKLRARLGEETRDFFSFRFFGFFTLGIFIVFVLFLCFFFRHSGISYLINSLPGLATDPEHPKYSLIFRIKHFIYCIITAHPYVFIPLVLYFISFIALLLDKKKKEHTYFHLLVAAALTIICYCLFIPELTEKYFNGIMFPLTMLGLSSYALLDKKPKKLFFSVFVMGAAYSLSVGSASNMGFDVISMALSVANIACPVFFGLLLHQIGFCKTKFSAVSQLTAAFTIFLLFALMLTVKLNHCFWDINPRYMDSEISCGPAKGIVTSKAYKHSYENVYNDMLYYRDKEPGNILVFTQSCWSYLMAEDMPYASFSAWLSGADALSAERLELYYYVNPDRAPDYIYIPKTNSFGRISFENSQIYEQASAHGFSVSESDAGYRLERN